MLTMMRDAAISFPMFGDFTINPSASFELFGHTFYWYGTIIALGFILAVLYCSRTAGRYGLTGDDIFDFILWALPLCVIGARLYFVAFDWDNFRNNLGDIIKIWEGGLAIYGAIIVGAVTAFVWCKVKKKAPLALFDLGSMGLLIGQLIGRWGNFMNREAFGAETDAFCRMGLTRPGMETVYVHPTFLYESLWNLLGFTLLHIWVSKGKRRYDGQLFLLYVFWYGLGRMFIEGLRTDSLYIGGTGIRVSQVVGGVSALAALVLLIIGAKKQHPPKYADQIAADVPPASDGDI